VRNAVRFFSLSLIHYGNNIQYVRKAKYLKLEKCITEEKEETGGNGVSFFLPS
jgi:hypothetical protein